MITLLEDGVNLLSYGNIAQSGPCSRLIDTLLVFYVLIVYMEK